MKFLVDENLPPRLAEWLRRQGYEAKHVNDVALAGKPDVALAAAAAADDLVIVTKDSDFDQRRDARVLRLVIGNCSTGALIDWLAPKFDGAMSRLASGELLVRIE
jgi:predicted nuclease of predicted toxin-antitoxin system